MNARYSSRQWEHISEQNRQKSLPLGWKAEDARVPPASSVFHHFWKERQQVPCQAGLLLRVSSVVQCSLLQKNPGHTAQHHYVLACQAVESGRRTTQDLAGTQSMGRWPGRPLRIPGAYPVYSCFVRGANAVRSFLLQRKKTSTLRQWRPFTYLHTFLLR